MAKKLGTLSFVNFFLGRELGKIEYMTICVKAEKLRIIEKHEELSPSDVVVSASHMLPGTAQKSCNG